MGNVADALGFFSPDVSWIEMWKALEEIEGDFEREGGRKAIYRNGWSTRSGTQRFCQTVNFYRHANEALPAKPMTLPEVRRWLVDVITHWIEYRASSQAPHVTDEKAYRLEGRLMANPDNKEGAESGAPRVATATGIALGTGSASAVGASVAAATGAAGGTAGYRLLAEGGKYAVAGQDVTLTATSRDAPAVATPQEPVAGTSSIEAGSSMPQAASLTIGPGASIELGPGASITLGGVLQDVTLEATGTVTDPPRPPPPLPPPPTEGPDEGPESPTPRTVNAAVTLSTTLDAVIVRAPPSIPEPRSAAISPEWVDGKLTIISGPAMADLPVGELMDALAAAGAELGRVLADIEASPGNVDRRIIEFARRVAAAMPTAPPDNFAVFVFGQKVDTLKRRVDLAVNDSELSGDRAAELLTAVNQLSDCILQFPAWRQFKRNARSAALTNEQVAGAPKLAGELANQLETKEAKEFVDESVPRALRDLAAVGFPATPGDPTGAIKEGADLLALDLIESAENVYKRVASAAVLAASTYLRDLGRGVLKGLEDGGERHGKRLVAWAFGLIGGAAALFPWAAPVLNFIKQIFGG